MPTQYIYQPMKPRDSRVAELCDFEKPAQGEFNRVVRCLNEATQWAYWYEANGKLCTRPAAVCKECQALIEADRMQRANQKEQ